MKKIKIDKTVGDDFLENLYAKEINQHDLEVPKVCKVPSVYNLLLNKTDISRSILNAYKKIVGESSILTEPYFICVYGSYPLMTSWARLMEEFKFARDSIRENGEDVEGLEYKSRDFAQYSKERILKRLLHFAEGFEQGFQNFKEDIIDLPDAFPVTPEITAERIFKFIQGAHSVHSFSMIRLGDTEESANEKWNNDGVQAGYFYCAWYSIFLNPVIFESYFRKPSPSPEILEKPKTAAGLDSPDRPLTFLEACLYLNLKASYLKKLTSSKAIPFSKPNGKRIYFDRTKLDEWMLSRPSRSASEVDKLASTYVSVNKI